MMNGSRNRAPVGFGRSYLGIVDSTGLFGSDNQWLLDTEIIRAKFMALGVIIGLPLKRSVQPGSGRYSVYFHITRHDQ